MLEQTKHDYSLTSQVVNFFFLNCKLRKCEIIEKRKQSGSATYVILRKFDFIFLRVDYL